ncbi:MAG: class I SAM-dependent methyltransferase [Drouetiella hepatica Uher 2000/2452]|jgi:SAM-dependent MidA family methyltransferase|uniref:Class I SAM-dependent methyltransferase n=1 Tax=Drouetiella hepatica Uher 2000/2452 TaxID=904376 RepID=A0A951QEN8_9CYAN|nr:class I SAM-dependent methyltransferase [Drouetiella hepatica Uher 2000/2452]
MTASPLKLADSHPALCEAIAQQIAQSPQQRITFAEFMDLALYHPDYGYYVAHSQDMQKGLQGGIQSDFFTSPHLGADLGELLAEQFAQMWELLDRPHPFTLVEMGAGQGLIVQDILRYLHRQHFECFEALEYIVIEKSPAMVAVQQQRLQKLTNSWGHLSWKTWDEIPTNSIVGCCFSNELVDAFPVHRVAIANGILQEIYVAIGEPFAEVIAELSTPKLTEYFDLVELKFPAETYPDNYQSEVNLAALDWIATVGDRLKTGYLLTIDYGYSAQRYYSPTRSQGTLQCYYQHAHHSDPYQAIGRQDITAHVDFTALEKQGDRCGLQTVGFTQQGLFLMALGLGDRIAGLSETGERSEGISLQDILRRRESLHALINPMGLGNFGVLVQSKGLDEALSQPLTGLTTPTLY